MNHLLLFEGFTPPDSNSHWYARLNMQTEDAFELMDYRDSYAALYPGYETLAGWAAEDDEDNYFFESQESAYAAANYALSIYDGLPNPITVYRTISVKRVEDIDHEFLGECWSYQRQSALNFGSHLNATVLMSGTVAVGSVDWLQTIKTHFSFSGGMSGDDEDEIHIPNAADVQDLKIEWIGKCPSKA